MNTKTSGTTTIKWTLTTVETPGTKGCQQQKEHEQWWKHERQQEIAERHTTA